MVYVRVFGFGDILIEGDHQFLSMELNEVIITFLNKLRVELAYTNDIKRIDVVITPRDK